MSFISRILNFIRGSFTPRSIFVFKRVLFDEDIIKCYCSLISGSTVQKMSFQGMLGVFILLIISIMVGLFIMIVEWIYASAKDSRKQVKVSKSRQMGNLSKERSRRQHKPSYIPLLKLFDTGV